MISISIPTKIVLYAAFFLGLILKQILNHLFQFYLRIPFYFWSHSSKKNEKRRFLLAVTNKSILIICGTKFLLRAHWPQLEFQFSPHISILISYGIHQVVEKSTMLMVTSWLVKWFYELCDGYQINVLKIQVNWLAGYMPLIATIILYLFSMA